MIVFSKKYTLLFRINMPFLRAFIDVKKNLRKLKLEHVTGQQKQSKKICKVEKNAKK